MHYNMCWNHKGLQKYWQKKLSCSNRKYPFIFVCVCVCVCVGAFFLLFMHILQTKLKIMLWKKRKRSYASLSKKSMEMCFLCVLLEGRIYWSLIHLPVVLLSTIIYILYHVLYKFISLNHFYVVFYSHILIIPRH